MNAGGGTEIKGETEQGMLMRLQCGDHAALGPLMDRYASRLYRVAFGITQNRADAEEVVQDVFLTLCTKAHTFEGRSALGSWLYRIATNVALMKRRARRPDREVALEPLLPTFLVDGHRAGPRDFLVTDWSQTPESELLSRETRDVVRRAIDALPDQYRAVLVLRDIEGLSNEEVADAVGESVAAAKSRLHRARMALREELTKHFGPRISA
jgi:RNA polymerase sigma-70 factor (ECF subfamily)